MHFWPPGSLRRSSGAFLSTSRTPGRPPEKHTRPTGAGARGPSRTTQEARIGQHRPQDQPESVRIGKHRPPETQNQPGGYRPPRSPESPGSSEASANEPDSASIGQNLLTAGGPQEPRSGQNRSESAPRSQESSRQESEAIVGQNRSAGNKKNEAHNNRRQKETRGRQPKPHYTTPLADKRSFEPTKAAATQPKTNLLHVNLIHGSTLVYYK